MRSAFRILAGNRRRVMSRMLKQGGWAQAAIVAVFGIVVVSVFAGMLLFFLRAFRFLFEDQYAGPVITLYLLEMAFAAVLFLGIASFVAAAFHFFFRAEEMNLLVPLPISPATLFSYRFTGLTFFSSWPVLLLATPALLALGAALSAGITYYLFALSLILLLAIAIAVFGGLLTFVLAPLARRLSVALLMLAEAVILVTFSALAIRRFISKDVFALFHVYTAEQATVAMSSVRDLFWILPSRHFAELVASILPAGGNGARTIIYVLCIAVPAAITYLILTGVARRWYLSLWQGYQESSFLAQPEDVARRPWARGGFPRIFRMGHSFMFEKDLLSLLRSPEELMRAVFLLSLLGLYIFALWGASFVEIFSNSALLAIIIAFMFAVIGYFSLTFGLRFAFPSLSQEGKSAWILWSSPVHAHEFFSWKFFFWSVMTVLVMESVTLLSTFLFAFPLALALMIMFVVFCTIISLIAITLGQGSIFPDFRERGADSLSTSPAGLVATALGLGYLWVVTRYVRDLTQVFLERNAIDTVSLLGIFIVSLTVITVYWILARRKMDNLEII